MEVLRNLLGWSQHPRAVLTDQRTGEVPAWLEDLVASPPAPGTLPTLYRRAEGRCRQREATLLRMRALLAEAAQEFDVTGRTPAEQLFHLGMQLRLSGNFDAARSWVTALLSRWDIEPLFRARLWRELAALHEVAGAYDDGLACIASSLSITDAAADDPAMRTAACQTHLQRSTLLRLSGRYEEARTAISDARAAAGSVPSPHIAGLIALRTAGLDLVIGHLEQAARAYAEAAQLFEATSPSNRRYALVRQVTCLREAGDLDEATALGTRLLAEVHDDPYRTAQVLLELAEVEIERANPVRLEDILRQADPLLTDGNSLEALRWRMLVARSVVLFRRDDTHAEGIARANLAQVINIAASSGRRDITRALGACHTLALLCTDADVPLAIEATRAAVVAAELQRSSLTASEDRWRLRKAREAVYAVAARLLDGHGRHADAATVLELGRADLIEEAVGGRRLPRTITSPTSFRPEELSARLVELSSHMLDDAPLEDRPFPTKLPTPRPGERFLSVKLIGHGDSWTVIRAVASTEHGWSTDSVEAPSRVCALLNRTRPLTRGVSRRTWRELAHTLLPKNLGAGPLVISPDPRLWCIPWPALPIEGHHLVDLGPLALTPSLRTHQILRLRFPKSCTVMVDIDDNLRGSNLERDALEHWARRTGGQSGLLYVAGHATSPETKVGITGLDFDALAASDLPELVVLNGCWTGVARPEDARDPFSLAVGALIGGAKCVIAGTGPIGSEASASVGALLLTHLANGHDPVSALRFAQIAVRNQHPEAGPMDWGGLVAVN